MFLIFLEKLKFQFVFLYITDRTKYYMHTGFLNRIKAIEASKTLFKNLY